MSSPLATKPEAHFFTLKSPLLAQGRLDNVVARTQLLTVVVKVYAAGGENAMHKHAHEDHSFIVLQGQATFHIDTDDNIRVLNKNEGVMLPRGVCYWFQSSAAENLVMLRIGASERWVEDERTNPYGRTYDGNDGRQFPDGRPFDGYSVENKEVERIALTGQFFAA